MLKPLETHMEEFSALESVLLQSDLSRLGPKDRLDYYKRVCDTVGLNPLTRPFIYISLNGKLVLYPSSDCARQLSGIHEISTELVSSDIDKELRICTARIRATKISTGQFADGVGIVSLVGVEYDKTKKVDRDLTPAELANAIMKAETKARRRAVLDLVGLTFAPPEADTSIPETASVAMDNLDLESLREYHEPVAALPTTMDDIADSV